MPHDRRTRRAFLFLIGVVCSVVPIGCMKSPNVRPDGVPLPELTPAGEPLPAARTVASAAAGKVPAIGPQAPAPNAAASPAQPLRATPPADPAPGVTDPALLQTVTPTPTASPGTDPATPPQPATAPPHPGDDLKNDPPPSSTPLLDAEIRRVEDVTRQHFESLHAADSSGQPSPVRPFLDLDAARTEAAETRPTPIPKPAPTDAVESLPEPAPLPIHLAQAPATPDQSPTGQSPAPIAADVKNARPTGPEMADDPRPDRSKADSREAGEYQSADRIENPAREAEGDPSTAQPTRVQPHLEIAELRLCSKVLGFGSLEPLDPNSIKPGQWALAYWEMSGLEFEARGEDFVTRLSSHFELRPERGGPIVWEKAFPTEVSVCRRRRRDNYANARIKLPDSLEPGAYRLRLIQTDLVAGRTASAEIPLTIAP